MPNFFAFPLPSDFFPPQYHPLFPFPFSFNETANQACTPRNRTLPTKFNPRFTPKLPPRLILPFNRKYPSILKGPEFPSGIRLCLPTSKDFSLKAPFCPGIAFEISPRCQISGEFPLGSFCSSGNCPFTRFELLSVAIC